MPDSKKTLVADVVGHVEPTLLEALLGPKKPPASPTPRAPKDRVYRTEIQTGLGLVEVDAAAFIPDWQATWTPARMEQELVSFKFKGPGWYLTKGERDGRPYNDSILLIPERMQEGQTEQRFYVCVWNHDGAANAFNWIVNAPTQVDER